MLSFISLYLKIELFPLSKGYYIISPVQSDKMTHLTHRSSESISFILSTDESYEKSVTTNHFNIFQNRRYHRHRQLLHKEDIDLGHSIRIQSALFRSPSLLSSLPLGNEHQLEMIATACLMWKERRSAVEIALFKKDEPGSNSPFK